MTKVILAAEQVSSNCKRKSEIVNKTNNHLKDYLSFLVVRKMIYKFLACDRVILTPTKAKNLTELELSNKLNITPKQLRQLQKSQAFYRQIIKKINLPLAKLYCNTRWQY